MKDLKLNPKNLLTKVHNIFAKLRPYTFLVVVVAIASCYGFLIFRINNLANREPSEDSINEKLQEVKRPKIDQKAVEQIQQLESSNIDVQAIFQQARDNPFQD